MVFAKDRQHRLRDMALIFRYFTTFRCEWCVGLRKNKAGLVRGQVLDEGAWGIRQKDAVGRREDYWGKMEIVDNAGIAYWINQNFIAKNFEY